MPRRSPARVRAATGFREPPTSDQALAWLSSRGRTALARLERDRFWPGAVAMALRSWARFVHDPAHRVWTPSPGCGVRECCPDLHELRSVLHAAVGALPAQEARALRRRLAELDELW